MILWVLLKESLQQLSTVSVVTFMTNYTSSCHRVSTAMHSSRHRKCRSLLPYKIDPVREMAQLGSGSLFFSFRVSALYYTTAVLLLLCMKFPCSSGFQEIWKSIFAKPRWLQKYSNSYNPMRNFRYWRCSFIYKTFLPNETWKKYSSFTPCFITNFFPSVVRLLRQLKWEWKTFQECQWRVRDWK